MIGFFSQTKLWFEGESHYGYGLVPMPVITLATVITDAEALGRIPKSSDLMDAKLVFREDSFDPVTRIRRGRFYFNPGAQPSLWHAHWHSFMPSQALSDIQLITFQRWPAAQELAASKGELLIVLGVADAFTLWRVIDVERISTADDLVTLRARASLGLLPDLSPEAIPLCGRSQVLSVIEKAIESAYRAGPESVIDRCRDAAQASIATWLAKELGDDSVRALDLSPLLERTEKALTDRQPAVLLNAGRIIARLHARKPNEQIKRGTRANKETDAEAALANLGLILREMGWTVD